LPTIIAGKILLPAALVFLCGALLPGIALWISHFALTGQNSFGRAALWILATTLYAAFWFSVVLLVNARAKTAAQGALALAAIWTLLVLFVPATANLLAQSIFPAFSGIAFADAERAARLNGNAGVDRIYRELFAELDRRYPRITGDAENQKVREKARMTEAVPVPTDNDLLVKFFASKNDLIPSSLTINQLVYFGTPAREVYIENRLSPLLAEMNYRKHSQQIVINGFSLFSPSMLLRRAAGEITGTGEARHTDFVEQFDDYVRRRNQIFQEKMLNNERLSAAEFDGVPKFNYREESTAKAAQRAALPLTTLLLLTVLCGFLAFRSYRQYKVAG